MHRDKRARKFLLRYQKSLVLYAKVNIVIVIIPSGIRPPVAYSLDETLAARQTARRRRQDAYGLKYRAGISHRRTFPCAG